MTTVWFWCFVTSDTGAIEVIVCRSLEATLSIGLQSAGINCFDSCILYLLFSHYCRIGPGRSAAFESGVQSEVDLLRGSNPDGGGF